MQKNRIDFLLENGFNLILKSVKSLEYKQYLSKTNFVRKYFLENPYRKLIRLSFKIQNS